MKRVVDHRLYRVAFAPALVALVITLFSFEAAPDPVVPVAPPPDIAPSGALRFATELPTDDGERAPGSEADDAAADAVAAPFGEIEAGLATEQDVETGGGESTNQLLTLPGDSQRTIVVLASRNAAPGDSAATASQATGALVEIGDALAAGRHDATYVIASLAGTAGDSTGVEELLDGLPGAPPEAVIAISAPAAAEPQAPYLLSASDGRSSPSAGLVATAAGSLAEEAGLETSRPGVLDSLARLALPAASGPQAELIGEGTSAVGLTSDGTPDPGDPGEPSARTLDGIAKATLATVEALDEATSTPPRGPATYAVVAGDLIPGWTLSVLALALILPALLAAVDGSFRAIRRVGGLGPALAWAGSRTTPLLAGIAVAVACSLAGLVPELRVPLPSLFGAGAGAIVALVLIALAIAATAWWIRAWRVPALPREACLAACGLVCSLAALLLWIANPYAALLAALAPHAWILLDAPDEPRRRGAAILAVILAAVPGVGALVLASGSAEFGGGSPWWALAAIGDGRLGLGVVLAAGFGLGAQLALVALALSDTPAGSSPDRRRSARWTDRRAATMPSDAPVTAPQSGTEGQTPGRT